VHGSRDLFEQRRKRNQNAKINVDGLFRLARTKSVDKQKKTSTFVSSAIAKFNRSSSTYLMAPMSYNFKRVASIWFMGSDEYSAKVCREEVVVVGSRKEKCV
jgi:hypothetical protein